MEIVKKSGDQGKESLNRTDVLNMNELSTKEAFEKISEGAEEIQLHSKGLRFIYDHLVNESSVEDTGLLSLFELCIEKIETLSNKMDLIATRPQEEQQR